MEITLQPFVGFSGKNGVKADIYGMLTAELQQLFNGKAGACKVVRCHSWNHLVLKKAVENHQREAFRDILPNIGVGQGNHPVHLIVYGQA